MKDKFPHLLIRPNLDFMNEVFSYNVTTLESTDSLTVSKYIIALSQYLIYLQSQLNYVKADVYKDSRKLETIISTSLTKDIVKQYSTKKDASNYLLSINPGLSSLEDKLTLKKEEMYLLEGTDKALMELIAAFKRELTRREQEHNYN